MTGGVDQGLTRHASDDIHGVLPRCVWAHWYDTTLDIHNSLLYGFHWLFNIYAWRSIGVMLVCISSYFQLLVIIWRLHYLFWYQRFLRAHTCVFRRVLRARVHMKIVVWACCFVDQWSTSVDVNDYIELASTIAGHIFAASAKGMWLTDDDPKMVAPKQQQPPPESTRF